jgi:4-hydroxy-2-oxoheptanedioate aldolase
MDLTEMCGYSGYDFIILDTEHGPMSAETCIPMICAAERTDMVPIIRVSENEKNYVLKALDIGAMGIVFPMINTAEDAKKAILLTKYIQKGNEKREKFRGMVNVSRAAAYGITTNLNTHIETSNNEIMIIVQFETKEAIENLDEILKFKEIDVVLIGSLDLSQSLGYPGEVDNPLVKDIIKKAIKKIVNAGKVAGMLAASPDVIKYWLDLGVKFITYHQTCIINEALQNHLTKFKELL